jgi:inorganic triphosphatase YgiF
MAVASELETELKYEAGAEPPSLGDLPGVSGVEGPESVRLSAVYFDTADLRLARHGATLRRRTGGADEGWHLKVPVGGDSRVELRLPLDDGPATNAPPEELAELTFGMARGAEIRPIALLKTKRRTWRLTGPDGKFVAEVAEDRVTARRLDGSSTEDKWQELEVELADPAAGPALDQALRKAGLRRSRHSSKLARVMPVPATPPPAGVPADPVRRDRAAGPAGAAGRAGLGAPDAGGGTAAAERVAGVQAVAARHVAAAGRPAVAGPAAGGVA